MVKALHLLVFTLRGGYATDTRTPTPCNAAPTEASNTP